MKTGKNYKITIAILAMAAVIATSATVDARSVKLSSKQVSITVKGKKTIRLKGVTDRQAKKARWTVKSGKKIVKLKLSKKKKKVVVAGKKPGKAKIECKVMGKKLACRITVKSAKSNKAENSVTPAVKATSNPKASEVPSTKIPAQTTEKPSELPVVTAKPSESPVVTARPTHIPTDDRLMAEPAKVVPYYDRGIINQYPTGPDLYDIRNDECYFFGSNIERARIERIEIKREISIPENALGTLDLSEKQNQSVMAWYLDEDQDNAYEMYIGQEGGVITNPNSDYLFSDIGRLTLADSDEILFGIENLYCDNMKSMRCMFKRFGFRSEIKLNLGEYFNTSGVVDMDDCFKYAGLINYKSKEEKVDTSEYMTVYVGKSFSLESLSEPTTACAKSCGMKFMLPSEKQRKEFIEKINADCYEDGDYVVVKSTIKDIVY
ncbi:hypothetical protein [Eubacterium xylanophilum]|uniref:hypothetical protein n=1 Tax=Eubacterium xylanophilum TaxID=39497 RepID=UPI00047AC5AC|nr:hypothetical protein [Eubacterium xylanophilum]